MYNFFTKVNALKIRFFLFSNKSYFFHKTLVTGEQRKLTLLPY